MEVVFHIKKVFLIVILSFFTHVGLFAGPGGGINPTGGFGGESGPAFGYSEMNSIQSDPGPGGGPGQWGPPSAIPIDGGVVAILVGGLLIGGRRLLKGVVRK